MDRNGNPLEIGKTYMNTHGFVGKYMGVTENNEYMFQKLNWIRKKEVVIRSAQLVSTLFPISMESDGYIADTDVEVIEGGKKKVFRRRKSKKILRKFRKSRKSKKMR
jgi:hypothetical protein